MEKYDFESGHERVYIAFPFAYALPLSSPKSRIIVVIVVQVPKMSLRSLCHRFTASVIYSFIFRAMEGPFLYETRRPDRTVGFL